MSSVPFLRHGLAAAAAVFLSFGSSVAVHGQSVTTAPVGALTQQVAGGTGSGSFTFLGIPLVRASVWQGALTTASGAVLNAAANSFTAAAFSSVPHYVIITEGSNAGLMVDIVSNTSNSITLGENIDGLISSSDKISVRPHSTLASLFGDTNSAGFFASNTSAAADEILVFNSTTQSFINYYYKNAGLGGIGWRSSASSSVSRANDIIYPEQSLAILRKQATGLAITSIGEVYSGAMKIPVESGLVWTLNTTPRDTTLASLGFYTGTSSGITGSNTVALADEVLRWTGTGWESFYYKTTGLGGIGWRTSASSSIDRGTQAIGAGEVLVIRRKSQPLMVTRPAFAIAN